MQRKINKAVKLSVAVMTVLSGVLFSLTGVVNANLPNSFFVRDNRELRLSTSIPVTAETVNVAEPTGVVSESGNSYAVKLKMLGVFPLKTVQVNVAEELEVVPLGSTFGIKIYTKGVIVTDIQAVDAANGAVNPGKEAGFQIGDVIEEINGTLPTDANHAARLIQSTNGETITFRVVRNGKNITLKLAPVFSVSEKCYKAGIWIKDSSAGIGTLTFYSPQLNVVAGLGHGICDTEANRLLPLSSGEMVYSEIFSFTKSRNGAPGELKGRFAGGSIGNILANNDTGVYAVPAENFGADRTVKLALKQEIRCGDAQMITTIGTDGPKTYDCVIEKISLKDGEETKNMLIRITDKELLSKTGGILQGMSGSPLIQNGKLVGAVTHVLVNDTTCGYAIFAENMLETAQSVTDEPLKAAS